MFFFVFFTSSIFRIMQIKKIFFLFLALLLVVFFSFCTKESQIRLSEALSFEHLPTSTTDRGGICPRQTLHYTALASTGSGNSAFTGEWMQELDRVANNCVLDGSLCQNVTSQGQTTFWGSNFYIFDILQLGGFEGTWPYVTPQGQDFLIAYTLNWARTHLPSCEGGTNPKIVAVDYARDPFISSTLIFTVRWTCCGIAVNNE